MGLSVLSANARSNCKWRMSCRYPQSSCVTISRTPWAWVWALQNTLRMVSPRKRFTNYGDGSRRGCILSLRLNWLHSTTIRQMPCEVRSRHPHMP
jgi:hypothetical protein